MHKKWGSQEEWSNYPCTHQEKTLMTFPSMWTLRPDFWRGGAGDKGSTRSLSTHLLDIAVCYSEETWETPVYLCTQSTLRKASQWKWSFWTPQKLPSDQWQRGDEKEALKASTIVETWSIHQSLFMRHKSPPISNEGLFPVFSSLALIFDQFL